MERLKPRTELLWPDIRNRNRANVDHAKGTFTEMTIDTIYDEVEKISVTEGAPEDVRSHFETARNLMIYSWFVYSFKVVATMHVFASLEMAVKKKTGDETTSFKNQLDIVFGGRKFSGGIGPPIQLSIAISKLRNELAHGSPMMHGQGLALLQLCAELINELYTEKPLVER